MESETPLPGHLESGELAAYLDRALPAADRLRLESHLADCSECRDELVAVARLLSGPPHRVRRWYAPVGLATAAAILFLLVPLRHHPQGPALAPTFREPAITSAAAAAALEPRGAVRLASSFVWSRVSRAERYRLMIFDATGSVVWETQTPDTSARLPEAIRLRQNATYFWKVEAQTGWNRWVASDLVEFSVSPSAP
jgi:hypothetical protein